MGYAVSDQDFQYLRYIDNGGTLKADSLLGVQAEAQFNPQWGATVQLVGSAPRTRSWVTSASDRQQSLDNLPQFDGALLFDNASRDAALLTTIGRATGVPLDAVTGRQRGDWVRQQPEFLGLTARLRAAIGANSSTDGTPTS